MKEPRELTAEDRAKLFENLRQRKGFHLANANDTIDEVAAHVRELE